jgi:hypothetical protein
LRPERRTEAELDAGKCEQLRPKLAGEDRISVAHNRARETVKADDLVEEDSSDGRRSVGVADRDEVSIFGEAVDYGEDDRFSTNTREVLDEVHGDVRPNQTQDVERLQQAFWM